MKTKDLIAALQTEDPSGEQEVCVGNADIHFVRKMPAYYDGCLEVLKRDASFGGYNIVGVEIRSSGNKIQINPLTTRCVLYEDPEATITYDNAATEDWYRDRIERWREEAREENADAT